MKRGIRSAAGFGLAVALVCLSAAPAAAAPRAEEPARISLLGLQGLADHVGGFLGDWVRSISARSGCSMDPDGASCPADFSPPPDNAFVLDTEEDRETTRLEK